MKKINQVIFLITIGSFLWRPLARADVFVVITDKEEKKKSVSWNLLDWMETKQKMALMDQWLALHTNRESLFEGYIGGEQGKYDYSNNGTLQKKSVQMASLGLFISLFGVEAFYEDSNEPYQSLASQFSLRILGPHKQSTNLALHYGFRNEKLTQGESVNNQYWGGSFTLYLVSFLGGEINYRNYLKGKAKISQDELTGNLLETTGFIDIYFLRLFATYFKERSHWKSLSGIESQDERKGLRLGAKIFF